MLPDDLEPPTYSSVDYGCIARTHFLIKHLWILKKSSNTAIAHFFRRDYFFRKNSKIASACSPVNSCLPASQSVSLASHAPLRFPRVSTVKILGNPREAFGNACSEFLTWRDIIQTKGERNAYGFEASDVAWLVGNNQVGSNRYSRRYLGVRRVPCGM